MSIQNLLNEFSGSGNTAQFSNFTAPGFSGRLSKYTNNLPGRLINGATAGGIMALLVGNKSARKFAGIAVSYGGAAILGGLAYKALKNWQYGNEKKIAHQENDPSSLAKPASERLHSTNNIHSKEFELKLIKAMIAASKVDEHIDQAEQGRIFKAIIQLNLSTEMKAQVVDLLAQPISIAEITQGVTDLTQKSELYLISCLAINPEHPAEKVHLDQLSQALELPGELADQIYEQAQKALKESAWPSKGATYSHQNNLG